MNRSTFLSHGSILAAAFLAAPAGARDGDFALVFPIDAPVDAPVFAIELPSEAYATLTTPDLADLVVVDALGREQPISVQRVPPPSQPAAPEALPLPLPIAMPGDASAVPGGLDLYLQRDADGRLVALDLRSKDRATAADVPAGWLVDVGDASRDGIDGLRLTPRSDHDFQTLVDIRASDDLVHWQDLQSALPLLRASGQGRRIERLDLRFPRSTYRYLMLRPVAGEAALPDVAVLNGLRRREAELPRLAQRVLEPLTVSDDGQIVDFPTFGPLPVQEATVRLADGDGILEYRLEERVGERWQAVSSGTAWRLSIGGERLEAAPQPLWRRGTGRLRLHLSQPAPAPSLVLGYAPDRVVVMANGTPPFRLLAGSALARRSAVPLGDPLAAVRQRKGEEWQPPLAAVGPPQALAGAAALKPPADPGRWALWALLGLGAMLVGALALRLLRSPPE